MASRKVHPDNSQRFTARYNSLFSDNNESFLGQTSNTVGLGLQGDEFEIESDDDEEEIFDFSSSKKSNSKRKTSDDIIIDEGDGDGDILAEEVSFGIEKVTDAKKHVVDDDIDNLVNGTLELEQENSSSSRLEEEQDEEVDFAGLGDDAENIVGGNFGNSVGGFVGGMNPEMEKNIKDLVQVLQNCKKKLGDLREKNKTMTEQNNKLRQERDHLEEEKIQAELNAERQIRLMQYKTIGGKKTGNMEHTDAQRKRDAARRQMYSGNDNEDDDDIFGKELYGSKLGILGLFLQKLNKFMRKHQLLHSDLRRIDARFGSSTASYFYFFKWIILNYCVVTVVCFGFLIKHIQNLVDYQNLTNEEKQSRWNSGNETYTYYDWQSRHWSELASFLPKFLMSSSFNPGDTGTMYIEDVVTGSTNAPPLLFGDGSEAPLHPYDMNANLGERLDYAEFLLLVNFLYIFFIGRKWIQEDRKAKAFELIEGSQNEQKYSKSVLNLWDHSLTKLKDIDDLKYSTMEDFVTKLHEDETADLAASYTFNQRVKKYARIIVSNLLYIGLQVASAYIIISMTTQASEFRQTFVAQFSNVDTSIAELLAGSVVPATVSVLNAMLPALIKILTNLEKWDNEGYRLKMMLAKLYIAKNLNVLIQIFSFVQLLDPILLRGDYEAELTRRNTEKRFQISGTLYAGPDATKEVSGNGCPNGIDQCRSDYYGAGVFQLVLTEFVISKFAAVIVPMTKKLVSRLRKKAFIKQEFDVAKQMVSLLFFQQLCFMSFPFCPFGTILICMMCFMSFKIDKFVLENYMLKPSKPWSAKDAAGFFVKFFFFSYAISLAVTLFILRNNTFPKACTLAQQVIHTQYYGTHENWHPLSDISIERSMKDIADRKDRTGLEELIFWEEYFYYKHSYNATNTPNEFVGVIAYIRNLTGYVSENAVSNTTLPVCTLSCGPFIFNKSFYQPLDRILLSRFKTAYYLAAENTSFVWGICTMLLMVNLLKVNKIKAQQQAHMEKDIAMAHVVSTLESKVKKLTESLQKLKQS